jgi:hypothetical protein
MVDGLTAWLGLLGPISIIITLVVIGLLSKRLGNASRASRYYLGFYVAAALISISVAARSLNLLLGLVDADLIASDPTWILLYSGLPALGVTVGVIVAWRYWSWLLAERN